MEKNELRENLIEVVTKIKEDRKLVNKIKMGLKQYKILPGKIQSYFYNTELLLDVDIDTVYILTEQIYSATGSPIINPKEYFTVREIKEIKTNFVGDIVNHIRLPYTFKNVLRGTEDDFILYIQARELKQLFENGLLQYNPETQREMRQTKKKGSDEIIELPKLVEKSIKEMEDLLRKGEMIGTIITFNARLGSTDDESGEELIYDEDDMKLTVTEGTLLDVLDGFHRINAIVRALRKDPSLDSMFKLNILHLGKTMAQQYFKQLNTTNSVGKGQLKKVGESRQADFIAKQLQYNSELKNKVAASDMIAPGSNFLVTFNTLADAIDDVFKIEDKPNAIITAKYLSEFFNELFFAFPTEFFSDISIVRKNSLINANTMFYGYIALAKRMKDETIQLNKLSNIVGSINFSRENRVWEEYEILNRYKKISTRTKKQVYKFFYDLDLTKYKGGGFGGQKTL
ncbi:DNA sulfur modification protein DndB [Bacillus salipaludis]|uniref:DNA sulfur modification protein DndB n=1 Tax=Bacillus salipaludis TaxID=2547811 RepID=A0AA90TWG4_9BACI|nr:DNA sulfur modification protein DndB [Bacillus salipaludis]MDQ6600740.1 DNA sulfur modification protein DndB [Bacillus salipaludis]